MEMVPARVNRNIDGFHGAIIPSSGITSVEIAAGVLINEALAITAGVTIPSWRRTSGPSQAA